MVALTKQMTKLLTWTPEGQMALERLKGLVHNCPKLYIVTYKLYSYFVNYSLPIIFYSAFHYGDGAYLYQVPYQAEEKLKSP